MVQRVEKRKNKEEAKAILTDEVANEWSDGPLWHVRTKQCTALLAHYKMRK